MAERDGERAYANEREIRRDASTWAFREWRLIMEKHYQESVNDFQWRTETLAIAKNLLFWAREICAMTLGSKATEAKTEREILITADRIAKVSR